MKSNPYSRRQWFKTSLGMMAAAGFAHTLQADEQLYANQIHPMTGRWMLDVPPTMKARLTSNENPYGPSDRAKMAVIEGFKDANLYSRHVAIEFKNKIASYEGVKADQVFLCAGLSEVLNLLGSVTGLQQGDMVSAHPTFDLMPALAGKVGGKWIQVPLNARYQHDLPAMEKAVTAKTKLVYICNPGNPCSTIVDPKELAAFCDRVSSKTLVFVDEAYNDYIPDAINHTMIDKVRTGKNVMIGRTMSKVHGFAGLRLAYVLAQAPFVKELEKYRTWEFSMNAPSMHAAIKTIDDEAFKQSCIKKNNEAREMTVSVLQQMGYTPLPSYTNFIIFQIKKEGGAFVQIMQERGIGLRSWAFNEMQWCRVSIGTMDDMKMFLGAMKEV